MAPPAVALVTGSRMPVPDPESHLLVAALQDLGVAAEIRAWDQPHDWAAYRLVVVRTPWDYSERLGEFLEWARRVDAATALVNPLPVLTWSAHKSYLLDLERAGVPIVPTTLVARGAPASAGEAALDGLEDVVIKPAVSAGGRGALRARRGEPEAAAHLRRLVADGDALVQPFIEGVRAAGERSLVFLHGRFSHAVRKLPSGDEFRVHLHYGGRVMSHAATPDELEVARAAVAVAPVPTAYARIDLAPGPSGPMVMEAECVEPQLFLDARPDAAERLARGLAERL